MSKHSFKLGSALAYAFRLTLASVALAGGVQAQEPGPHPALLSSRTPTGIDPSTFIVGHPARGSAGSAPVKGRHPALAAHAAPRAGIDPNAFLVQPPATTRWSAAPQPAAVQVAQPAGH
ncbi:hypothetical protein [Caldimonas tepidiphila]|uniref:hypothetical protein n=1 Tax=Caldimonas tepidiphila TaxID=2315841 RepID=UPI000E5AA39B|nr:hypothetical protein [Caldimonas tepidiphila]